MEKPPTPPVLVLGLNPGAPVQRARETAERLLALLGAPPPEPPPSPPARPRLTLLKGGKVDDPVKPTVA